MGNVLISTIPIVFVCDSATELARRRKSMVSACLLLWSGVAFRWYGLVILESTLPRGAIKCSLYAGTWLMSSCFARQ